MLSRIRFDPQEIATIDTGEWIDPDAFDDGCPEERLPILADGLNLQDIAQQQKEQYDDQRLEALDEESGYELINDILYSVTPPTPTSASYPRLVLPKEHRAVVIRRSHKEVGHMATQKTLDRVREAYVWPGMRGDIKDVLERCEVCQVHRRKVDQVPMGEMPVATYPMQILGCDLIGPLPPSTKAGNRYILLAIDHCSGWIEAYPIPNKSNVEVYDKSANEHFSRHGIPEVIFTDNGKEFTAREFEEFLKKCRGKT